MAKKPHKYTKKLQFSRKVQERIYYRDNKECIFCAMGYYTDCKSGMLLEIKDIMHYIPKSSMGLGIEQNGALGCRYHHELLDNGNHDSRDTWAEMAGCDGFIYSVLNEKRRKEMIGTLIEILKVMGLIIAIVFAAGVLGLLFMAAGLLMKGFTEAWKEGNTRKKNRH